MLRSGHSVGSLAAALFVLFAVNAEADDATAAGEKVFRKCQACHSIDAGANKVGPSLAGVVGRKAGALPDYLYSSALQQSEVVWDEASLDAFLAAPSKFVPGTKMTFVGLKQAEDRASVIAYMQAASPAAGSSATAPAAPAGEVQAAAPTANGTITGGYVPNVKYTLRSGIAEGRMVFIGFGGAIDGVVNPELVANEGDVV
jgi:nitrite reductase (NO-forming)